MTRKGAYVLEHVVGGKIRDIEVARMQFERNASFKPPEALRKELRKPRSSGKVKHALNVRYPHLDP